MASSKQTKTKKNVYTCPLCDNVLDVDSTFIETRCENCGMYVVNTDQELGKKSATKQKTGTKKSAVKVNQEKVITEVNQEKLAVETDQEKLQADQEKLAKAFNLCCDEKYAEAIKEVTPLLSLYPDNPAVCFTYSQSRLSLFFNDSKKAQASNKVICLPKKDFEQIEKCCNVLKEYNNNNPNHNYFKLYEELFESEKTLLSISSINYASDSAMHNLSVLNGNNSFSSAHDCVKIKKDNKKTSAKVIKKSSYKDYLDDPEPIPFPGKSGIKWLTITFWVLGVLSLLSLALILGIWVDRSILASWNLDFSKYNFRDLLVPSGLGAMIIAIWLSWFIYWIVRKFKKIDSDEFVVIKWARRVAVVALILSVVYLVWKIIAVVICNTAGTTIDTGMSLETEKQSLYNTIFVILGLISLLIIFKTINVQRFYDDMNNKPFTFASFIRYTLLGLTFIALGLLIILNICLIIHLISKNLVNTIFGTEAEVVKQIVKYGLIASAATLVLGITIDVIWTSLEKKKNEKEVAKNLEEIKKDKEKNAGNIKIVYMSDISVPARAKANLRAILNESNKKIDEINTVGKAAFADYDYKTYDQIDNEIYTALTSKPFSNQATDKK